MKLEPREYQAEVQAAEYDGRLIGVTIRELPHDKWEDGNVEPDSWVYLGYFGGKYYGGCGGGREYPDFGQALLGSLYDELQTHYPDIPEGTTFRCDHEGQTYLYAVNGFHVVPVARIPIEA